jgi:DNA-binding transcriptional MocR family regulator
MCRLPGDVNAAEVARRALAEQIVLAPGNVFSIAHSVCFLRFNVAMMDDERIYSTLSRLCAEVERAPARCVTNVQTFTANVQSARD